MGEYERTVIDFTAILVAPHLGMLLLAIAVIALAAVAVRLVRVAEAAVAARGVLAMVTAWASTASARFVLVEARARAPSRAGLLRA